MFKPDFRCLSLLLLGSFWMTEAPGQIGSPVSHPISRLDHRMDLGLFLPGGIPGLLVQKERLRVERNRMLESVRTPNQEGENFQIIQIGPESQWIHQLLSQASDQHRHDDREHRDHEHGDREHGDREHGDREHDDRDHGDRGHGDHKHGDREHGDREHGDHKHGDHEHGDHEHGDHEHGDHDDHMVPHHFQLEQIRALHESAERLEGVGLPEIAHELHRQAEEIEREIQRAQEHHPEQILRELMENMHQLRREVREVNERLEHVMKRMDRNTPPGRNSGVWNPELRDSDRRDSDRRDTSPRRKTDERRPPKPPVRDAGDAIDL